MKIFCYHGVVERPDNFDRFFPKNISVNQFKEQVRFLKKNNRVLSLAEFEDKWGKRKLDENDVMLFFDDGYRSALNGFEILEKAKLPAVLAVSSDLIDKGYSWIDEVEKILGKDFEEIVRTKKYLRTVPADKILKELKKLAKLYGVNPRQINREKFEIMSWGEIAQIKSAGFDIVHHSHRHYPMSSFGTEKEILNDISINIEKLKEKLDVLRRAFVYPFGSCRDYDQKTKDILEKMGFKFAFNTEKKEINYNRPFDIPRAMVLH